MGSTGLLSRRHVYVHVGAVIGGLVSAVYAVD